MSAGGLPSKRRKIDYADYLRVLVGPEQKDFMVHRDIITQRSTFFQKVLTTSESCAAFATAATTASAVVTTPAAIERHFPSPRGIGKDRIHTTQKRHMRTLAFLRSSVGESMEELLLRPCRMAEDDAVLFADYANRVYHNTLALKSAESWSTRHLVKLCLLADKLGELERANLCIDYIICFSDIKGRIRDVDEVRLIYERTANGSPLRTLMLHYFIHEATPMTIKDSVDELPIAFLQG
ncbi:hypothetical protein LTR78_006233 [Recurvomyces mirabilis]|uniref:BTB domain-containing protein n=1 Tax=Recurvomyces mirabilis TaxID=574656 RepID=A0AAE0WLR3_9PEZI|nr:hypothetical protein LTR78_006233 [Recurvomyces mirabilis]KAK5152074.1 hypothetical protein LTS14_008849 [Recurvomyces mirabilis]